jgi:hypothetical protein
MKQKIDQWLLIRLPHARGWAQKPWLANTKRRGQAIQIASA